MINLYTYKKKKDKVRELESEKMLTEAKSRYIIEQRKMEFRQVRYKKTTDESMRMEVQRETANDLLL